MSSPHDLLKGFVEVSSLPLIYTRINEAINNPNMSMAEISRIIGEDSGLSARILRIVNSAFYSFPTEVETVARAVAIVGTQQLRALALATSVMQVFRGIPQEMVDMESFWRHSIACGLAAKVLAGYRRDTNPEFFFTAGIVHDIGRLIIFVKASQKAREALFQSKRESTLLYASEQEILGFDHAAVGRALAQAWKLSPRLEEVVACHHTPTAAVRYPVETATIHVADIVAHALQLGDSGESFVPPMDREAWASIGLPSSVFAPAMDQIERQFQDSIHLISTDSRS
jgi:HD-like signal output (HDOD) protein